MNHQRTIQTILNLRTGVQVEAHELLSNPQRNEVEIFQLRSAIETHIQLKTVEYVCTYCKQPVAIRGRKATVGKHFFFGHLRNSEDCLIKTCSGLTKEQRDCIKYNGVKESLLHITLKEMIGQLLVTEPGIRKVWVDKVYKDLAISHAWRKPDVLAQYGSRKIAFELQLITTYLSVIVGRTLFYRSQGIFLVWVFHTFSIDADMQKFTQKDVYYNNRFNVCVFDGEAQERSKAANRLTLKCFYQAYYLDNQDELQFHWEYTFITLADIQFNETTGECYYTNAEEKRALLLQQAKQRKNEAVIVSCVAYIKEAYRTGTIPPYKEYYPFHNLDEEMAKELNKRLGFATTNRPYVSNLFYKKVKQTFLCLVCEEKNIDIDFSGVTRDGRPLLQEILSFEKEREFAFYLSRLFRGGYSFGPADIEVLECLNQKNYLNQSEHEKEQVRRWALCRLYGNLQTRERAYEVMELEKVVLAFASLKLGFCIGNRFSNLLQLSHHFLEFHKDFGKLYMHALQVYGRLEEHLAADKTGKFQAKAEQLTSGQPTQLLKYNTLIYELFPEL